MTERNHIFDAIKALAIWLVVLGHCIQYLSSINYWNDGVFQFIYSFHMPLFFMVSGFFFASSAKLGWWEFLRKKTLTLLLPCFVWGVIEAIVRFDSWSQVAADILLPTHWPFWFFKGLFLVQVFAYIVLKITKRMGGGLKFYVCSLVMLSLLVYAMPYMAVPRVMLPVFWIGYVMKMKYEQFVTYHRTIGISALVLFVGLYYFWTAETMQYSASASVTLYHVLLGKHGYTWMNLLTLGYRILLGITGSVAVIAAMHETKSIKKYISDVGASTAGIYVLQTFIVERGLHWLFHKFINLDALHIWLDYFIMVCLSILLVVIINWIYQIVKQNPYINLLLFGNGN